MQRLLLSLCCLSAFGAFAQSNGFSVPNERTVIQATTADGPTFVAPPVILPQPERTASFVVNYTGFSTEAQAAFQYAVDIWSSLITSDVPIVIDATWEDLPGNTLGSAGATGLWYNFGGAPSNNVLYPSPLADKLAGSDLEPGSADMVANFDSGTDWYFGLDGNTPFAQYDLVSVVLHEIGHGLGFAGTMYVGVDLNGYVLNGSLAHIYDEFVYTGNNEALLDFGNGTAALADALLGDNLYWAGIQGNAQSGDFSPKLYAPSGWEQGSSLSHFDESTYPAGSVHSLMTPQIGNGEAIHSPGPMALGVLEDIGWTVDYAALGGVVGAPGCNDEGACNFDPEATLNDGSCIYPVADEPCADCISVWSMGATLLAGESETFTFGGVGAMDEVEVEVTWTGEQGYGEWVSDVLVVLCDPDGDCVEWGGYDLSGGADSAGVTWPEDWETEVPGTLGATLDLSGLDLSGLGTWSLTLYNGWSESTGLELTEVTFTVPHVCPLLELEPGCTDEAACNFEPEAEYNDGSCDYFCFTCVNTLIQETFQGYDDIQPLTVQSSEPWVTWSGTPGSTEDPFVVFNGVDGAVSLLSPEADPTQASDLYLPIGATEGQHLVQFALDVSPSNTAYYNFQADVVPGVEWALEAYIGLDGTTTYVQGEDTILVDGFQLGQDQFLSHLFDLDDGELRILNGANLILELDYPGNLGGVNFYPASFGGGIGAFLLDDVTVCEISTETPGCNSEAACNYDPDAVVDDGSCWTPEDYGWCDCEGNQLDALGICGGACAADVDQDGICDDVDECIGPDLTPEVLPTITSSYIAEVSLDGAPVVGMTVFAVANGETIGVDEAFEFEGGSWVSMSLYVLTGDEVEFYLFDEVTCTVYDDDLIISVTETGGDLSTFFDPDFLPFTGAVVTGCTDGAACNFNPDATFNDGGCQYPEDVFGVAYVDCNGNCLNDADADGVCDEAEVAGCTDLSACNFNPEATEDDASCQYPVDLFGADFLDCDGECLNDDDGDGVCNELEVSGCTDSEACNFDEGATDDDGTCAYLAGEAVSGNADVTVGDTQLYTVSPSDPDNTYTWAVSGGTILSGQGTAIVTIEWTTEGSHALQVIETNASCNGDLLQLDVTVSPVISVEEQVFLQWAVHPNPAQDAIRMHGLPQGTAMSLRLLQSDGRLVREWTAVQRGTWVGLDGLAPGWYILEGVAMGHRAVRPLLKE